MQKNEDIAKKLVDAHRHFRTHLLTLYEGVDAEKWTKQPEGSNWCMQSIAVEILNYELKTLSKCSKTTHELVKDNISISEFKDLQSEVSAKLIEHLENEDKEYGFRWITDGEENPTFHWMMVRTIQHGIYHAGGISLLRGPIGLKRASYDHWPQMVDSVFSAALQI